ncbi:hypothetical protein [Coprobacter sp.]
MKKYIFPLIVASSLICGFTSCDQSDELPPKTENSSTKYLLPQGTIMTSSERALCNDKKDEYEQATK